MSGPSLSRKLATLADRPGGRSLLAALSSRWARWLTKDPNIRVIYDRMWIDVVDDIFLPRSTKFQYYAVDFQHMRHFATERLEGALDYWTFLYKPKLGDVIIDVGAGIGIDAMALSKLVGSVGQIHCLEAHPRTFAALKMAKELNNLSNVRIYNLAIADGPSQMWISDLDNDEGNSVSRSSTTDHSIAVTAIDLDGFVRSNNIDRIDLLKMNIEGAERLAIRGMAECIERTNHVVIACHDFRGDVGGTKQPVIDFLKAHGFRIVERSDDPRPYVRDHVHAMR